MAETKQADGITKVHISKGCVPDYVSGVREPIAVRIDTGVYKRFKPLSKRLYGSTCRAVETYMISLIEVAEKGVHFSNTDKPINIEKIVIERNLRPRRNFELAQEEQEKVICHFCSKSPVGDFVYLKTGEKFPLCRFHVSEFVNGKTWGLVKHE